MTGHCTHSYDCDRWRTGCGKCPHKDVEPAIKRDSSRLQWKLKKRAFRRSYVTAVVSSSWLEQMARQSLLQPCEIVRIPPAVDAQTFRPLDRKTSRAALGLDPDRHVIMFAAASLTQRHKGGDLLIRALRGLPPDLAGRTTLLLLGDAGEAFSEALDMDTFALGFVQSDRLKAIAYSAADLFVAPSRVEAFGLVSVESLLCGTPVVAFRVGGIPDVVRPDVSGILAEPEDVDGFRDGIIRMLTDAPVRHRLGRQGRSFAEREFSRDLCVKRHIALYEGLLRKRSEKQASLNTPEMVTE